MFKVDDEVLVKVNLRKVSETGDKPIFYAEVPMDIRKEPGNVTVICIDPDSVVSLHNPNPKQISFAVKFSPGDKAIHDNDGKFAIVEVKEVAKIDVQHGNEIFYNVVTAECDYPENGTVSEKSLFTISEFTERLNSL